MHLLVHAMFPEIVLCAAACILILMGVSNCASTRRMVPVIAVLALFIAGVSQFSGLGGQQLLADRWSTVRVFEFARYIKMLASGIGILLVMLAWPSDDEATGNAALHFGQEAGEFFGLMLLSIAGIYLVAGANDIMLLFLGIEMASFPTYIMVSISRPLAVAQEAGVKYFFLGAMAAAIMLFGFSYLYGTTGTTKLDEIAVILKPGMTLGVWQTLAVVMLVVGFAFKMAAVPMHVYAGDVYQGAATPVTAFLSFVPKISGFVALLKVLYAVSGGAWHTGPTIFKLLWIISALTMTVGNFLGLVQPYNVKRVLAYSSIAHSGYMLAAVAALVHTDDPTIQTSALQGVLFYLAAYGLMNIGAFGVLIMLPSRQNLPATSAETFEDLAGQGRTHIVLGLAMATSCFSLIGMPLTIGFFGKYYLIQPTYQAGLNWLVIILVANAAVSAAYYLKIVATMFMPPPSTFFGRPISDRPMRRPVPILISVAVSMIGVLWLGIVFPATDRITTRTVTATHLEPVANP
jgi:NADH-quinone oxidoreductase subunit N